MRSFLGALLCLLLTLTNAQHVVELDDGHLILSNFSETSIINSYLFTLPSSSSTNQSNEQVDDDYLYELRVSVNSYTGDADVFVSLANDQTNVLWTSYQQTSSVLLIHQSNLVDACNNQLVNCTFAINVKGAGFHSIIVTAFSNNQSTIASDDQPIQRSIVRLNHPYHWPVNGKVSHHDGVQIYQLRQPANQTINPTVTQTIHHWRAVISPTYGNPEMIITTVDNLDNALSMYQSIKAGDYDQYNGVYANSNNQSIWFTTGYGIESRILTLNSSVVGYCVECDYVAIVYTRMTFSCEYLLSFYAPSNGTNTDISYQTEVTWLIQNQPLLRTAHYGDSHRFQTNLIQTGNDLFSLSMTRLIGNVSMMVYVGECKSIDQTIDPSINQNFVFDSKIDHSHVFLNRSQWGTAPVGVTTYCLIINSHSNSSYTVTTSTINQSITGGASMKPIRLIDGLPQEDLITQTGRFYLVSLPVYDQISYSISRRYGDFLLYDCGAVNHSVSRVVESVLDVAMGCTLEVTGDGLGAYTSSRKSPDAVPSGQYLIALFPRYDPTSAGIDVTLTATLGYTPQILRANVPVPAIIAGQDDTALWSFNSSFYVFYWPYETNQSHHFSPIDLVFHVSVFTGHITLYASDTHYAGPNNFNWTSDRSRLDTIIIPAHQLRRGPYFITAVAAHDTTFAITAIAPVVHHSYNETTGQIYSYAEKFGVQLQPGLPFNAHVERHQTEYFYLTIPMKLSANITIALTPVRGRAYLMINKDGMFPNPWNQSTWSAHSTNNQSAVQALFIPHNQWCKSDSMSIPGFVPADRCRYIIAVHGVSMQTTHYQLQAILADSTNVLQVSVPQIHSITYVSRPGVAPMLAPGRFQFYVPNDSSNVTLSITTLMHGQPGLFLPAYNQSSLLVGRHSHNVSTAPDWALINQLIDGLPATQPHTGDQSTIFIDPTDPVFTNGQMQRGYYWAEVRGPLHQVYSLALTMNHFVPATENLQDPSISQLGNSSMTMLIDGQAQRRSVFSDGSHAAIFKFEPTTSIHQGDSHRGVFRLMSECLSGGPVAMFARNDGLIPSADPHDMTQFHAFSVGPITHLRVPYILPHWDNATHQFVNTTNDWIIRVQAIDVQDNFDLTTFRMLASSQFDRLEDGEPEFDIELHGHTGMMFSFIVEHPIDEDYVPLFIEMTVQSGSATLFATDDLSATLDTLPFHHHGHHSWMMGEKIDGRNSVFRKIVQPGRWLIAVINDDPAINRSVVGLVATSRESIRLIDGVVQSASIDSGNGTFVDHMMFSYDYSDAHNSTFVFKLTPENPRQNLNIFATFDGTRPTSTNYQWNSTTQDADSMTRSLVFYAADPAHRPSSIDHAYQYLPKTLIHILVQIPISTGFHRIPFHVVGITQKNSSEVSLNDGVDSGPQVLVGDHFQTRHFSFELAENLPTAFSLSKQHGTVMMYLNSPSFNQSLWPTAASYEHAVFVNTSAASGHLSVNFTRPGLFRATVVNQIPSELAIFSLIAYGQRTGEFIEIGGEEAIGGFCRTPSAAYRLPVPDITNDVHIHIRPANHASFQYSAGLTVRIARSPNMHANETLMMFPAMTWNESIDIMGNSEHLMKCSNDGKRFCTLYITIDCVLSDVAVDFTVIAQRDGDVMPLDNIDFVPPMHVSTDKSANFVVLLPNNANPLRVVAWPCFGRPLLYMSQHARYPTALTAEYSSKLTNAINLIDLPAAAQPARGSQWYTAVTASGNWDAYFALEVINADPLHYEPLMQPLHTNIQLSNLGAGSSIDLSWEPSTINEIWAANHNVNDYDVHYDIYVSTTWQAPAVLWTRCGLDHIGATKMLSLSNSTLSVNQRGLFSANIPDLDAAQTYAVTIVAVVLHKYNETQHGYGQFAYDFSTLQPAQPSKHHAGSDDGAEIAEIIAAIFLPLFFVAGAAAFWYYRKNKRMQEEYALEMPDVESLDVTPAARRRGQQNERQARLVEHDSLANRQ